MSARGAGQERRYDVYVGVDVFGRGCFGGGGWNTNKVSTSCAHESCFVFCFFKET